MANKLINYTNRDFESLRADLINYVKTRHADKFAYFNDASTDMMYLEMLAYIGDNLNFQVDTAFNETFRLTAQNREAIIRIADNLGFYEWHAKPSITQANISIEVPPTMNEEGSALIPHPSFLLSLNPGLICYSNNNDVRFECDEEINFANDHLRSITPNYDSNGYVKTFTITKTIKLIAGETKYQKIYIDENNRKEFMEVFINDVDVTEVMAVVERPGNVINIPSDAEFRDYDDIYVEVNDLSENKIFVALSATDNDDYEMQQIINAYTDMSINYGLWMNKPKRFITRHDVNGRTKIIFGNSIIDSDSWETLIGNIDLSTISSFAINQIYNNNSLGQIPNLDSTLFIKYRTGAGEKTNVLENEITDITSKSFKKTSTSLDSTILNKVKQSLKIYSNIPAIGGRDAMKNDEIKQAVGKIFAANNRIVTYEDIVAMINKMPPSYGVPFRVAYEEIKPKVISYSQIQNYVNHQMDLLKEMVTNHERQVKIQEIKKFMDTLNMTPVDKINDIFLTYEESSEEILSNAKSLWLGEKCNLYVLGVTKDSRPIGYYRNSDGVFVSANTLVKNNIKRFLINKKLIGDWINIVDANVINFQIEFKIIADNKNKQKVLIDCLNRMKAYFSVYNWNINQPIYVSTVQGMLLDVEGVINVVSIDFYNIFGEDTQSGKKYSEPEIGIYYNNEPISTTLANNRFKMKTVNNVILSRPSDMFHVKFPEDDIIGKVI